MPRASSGGVEEMIMYGGHQRLSQRRMRPCGSLLFSVDREFFCQSLSCMLIFYTLLDLYHNHSYIMSCCLFIGAATKQVQHAKCKLKSRVSVAHYTRKHLLLASIDNNCEQRNPPVNRNSMVDS